MDKLNLNIADIDFQLLFEEKLEIKNTLEAYESDQVGETIISIVSGESFAYDRRKCKGEDLFSKYYETIDGIKVELKGAKGFPAATISYDDKMKSFNYEIGEQMKNTELQLDKLLALLPIRQILNYYDAFIFHSSRIEMKGKAILFTGKSGAGKTTQAKLWKETEKVSCLCNDRTIIRKVGNDWNTYGYFQDGSEPIGEPKRLPLGAIVLIEQGNENKVAKLKGRDALKVIIEQAFLDKWDYKMLQKHMERSLDLINSIPVYHLLCTKSKEAVKCLKEKLIEEEII